MVREENLKDHQHHSIHHEVDMNLCIAFHGNPSNNRDISILTTNINLMVELEGKSLGSIVWTKFHGSPSIVEIFQTDITIHSATLT